MVARGREPALWDCGLGLDDMLSARLCFHFLLARLSVHSSPLPEEEEEEDYWPCC